MNQATAVVGYLRPHLEAGTVGRAGVAFAEVLARRAGVAEPAVWLAAALAASAPGEGHACADLARPPAGTPGDGEATDLVWPDPVGWARMLRASPVVADGGGPDNPTRPLVLDGNLLYLRRYWRFTRDLAAALGDRAGIREVDTTRAAEVLDRLFGQPDGRVDRQRLAAATAMLRRLTVVSGPPGTGKTSTATRILAALIELDGSSGPPRIALGAPTGKAAARLGEAITAELDRLGDAVGPAARAVLSAAAPSTVHRLLGSSGPHRARFRHHADNPLEADVVVVDEASMVPLALMARLVDAVDPSARLVLLGDADQLASVEAGSVLGDICGPRQDGDLGMSDEARAALAPLAGVDLPGGATPVQPGIRDAVITLDRYHRFGAGSGIGDLARCVRAGDSEGAVALLGSDAATDVARHDPAGPGGLPPQLAAGVLAAFRTVAALAEQGRAAAALDALDEVRVLCALRRGPDGVEAWNAALAADVAGAGAARGRTWWPGRPVLVTANDYGTRLFNGDVGVCVRGANGSHDVVFRAPGGVRRLGAARLGDHETAYATTIHKSQGSQVRHAVVVLGQQASPIHTRELVYTGVTRASARVDVVSSPEVLRQALEAQVVRSGGLAGAVASLPIPPPASSCEP